MRLPTQGLLALALSMVAVDLSAQSPGEKLVYTSLAPCRIVDTRSSAAGPLAPGAARTFHVVGFTSDFAGQGGTAGGCGVPGFIGPAAQVQAVVVNLVAVDAQGPGNLRAWASDQSLPLASVINYAQVTGLNIANGIVVPVRQDQEGSDLSVRADVSGAHLVADVMGYFRPMALGEADLPVVPISKGGTGATVQTFVDLSSTQTVGGDKAFSGNVTVGSLGVGGNANVAGTFGAGDTFLANATLSGALMVNGGGGITATGNVSATDVVAAGMVSAGTGYKMPGTGAERLKMLRGGVSSTGPGFSGGGYTSVRLGLGQYRINFNSSFQPFPAVLATVFAGSPAVTHVVGVATTFALVNVVDLTGAPVDNSFWFIVIGIP